MTPPLPGLDFQTRKPSSPIFCHQDFLEKLHEHPAAKRASLLLQHLAVDPGRLHYKSTQGINRGWRRSRLGGSSGSHFYAWWAPRGATSLKTGTGFDQAPEGSVFLRDIRHHDDHAPLAPHDLADRYLPLTVGDLRQNDYAPSPFSTTQTKFARTRHRVSILKGHPGSGKTTALWHAADVSGATSVLYITYSRDLAALAQEYFDRFCSADRTFRVVTVPALMREITGSSLELLPEAERRARFLRDLCVAPRILGPWADLRGDLYEELHAHLIGEALPEKAARFEACQTPRVPEKIYRERRSRFIGAPAAAAAAETVTWLARNRPDFEQTLFPELHLAWRAAATLRNRSSFPSLQSRGLLNVDLIAIDEVQDLTPIEAFAITQLLKAAAESRSTRVSLLLAGDEAQTVRPTDFEWAWLNDILHHHAASPTEFKLTANLRSPRRIAELVNRVWDLYSNLSKQDRPSGTGTAEIEEDSAEQIIHCVASPGPDLTALLENLAAREGLAIISVEQPIPAYVPAALRSAVLTAAEAKGLDFQSIAVLGAGRKLAQITENFGMKGAPGIEHLGRRLAIDELRVVLSRPTERLYWIDVNPTKEMVLDAMTFLNGPAVELFVSPAIPAAVLRTLEEEQLDLEERVQRCQTDARQFLTVRPEMAWSRAQQAVTLLRDVDDMAARQTAYLTLAEVAFALALRAAVLPPELGRPNLIFEAADAAKLSESPSLARTLYAIARESIAAPADRVLAISAAIQAILEGKDDLKPWVLMELEPRAKIWLDQLEAAAASGRQASKLIELITPFYGILNLPDSADRLQRLKQRCIGTLLKERAFVDALAVLRSLPDRRYSHEALCQEGMGDYMSAAESYLAAGDPKEALACYRKIPDFERTLQLVEKIPDHPAAASLRWVRQMQVLAAERPPEFSKVMLPPEKKLLEGLLEQSLGVSRKKPAAKKAAPRKRAAVAKKQAPPKPRL